MTEHLSVLTDTQLAELKQLIEKATPGRWWIDSHGSTMVSFQSDKDDHKTKVIFVTRPSRDKAYRHPETGNLSYWENDWDASYIATANPDTIKSLIRRLELAEAKLKEHNIE